MKNENTLRRKAYNELVNVLKRSSNKCVILLGAPKIGKTYLAKEIGNNEYKATLYFDLKENSSAELLQIKDVDALNSEISKRFSREVSLKGKKLIIIDQIEESQLVRSNLDTIAKLDYDILVTGNMYGLKKQTPSQSEVFYKLYGLDFEEYMYAYMDPCMKEGFYKQFFTGKSLQDPFSHHKLLNLYREYIAIGGYPNVVDSYRRNHNLKEACKISNEILFSIIDDIKKYNNSSAVLDTLLSIPTVVKDSFGYFEFNRVKGTHTKNEILEAIDFLEEYGLVYRAYSLIDPKSTEILNREEFKLYLTDISLYSTIFDVLNLKEDLMKFDADINMQLMYDKISAQDEFIKLGLDFYTHCPDDIVYYMSVVKLKDGKLYPFDTSMGDYLNDDFVSYMDKFKIRKGYKLSYGIREQLTSKIIKIPYNLLFFFESDN